jgi:hypothetical protein
VDTFEVARELGVSQQRVRKLLADGRLTATLERGAWAFDPAEVARFKAIPRKTGRPRKVR